MLAWFKKKFGKKPAESEQAEPESIQDAVAASVVSEPVAESAPEIAPTIKTSACAEQEPEVALEEGRLEPEEPLVQPVVHMPESETVVASSAGKGPAPTENVEIQPDQAVVPVAEPPVRDRVADTAPRPDEPEFRQEAEATAGRAPCCPAVPLFEKNQEKTGGQPLFKRLRDRLGKTRDALVYRLDQLFLGKREIDQDLFEQLEEILITADLGVATTMDLLDRARKKVKREQLSDPQSLKNILRTEILAYITCSDQPAELVMPEEGPFVIMVVGVNGVGKTTSIGKIAAKFVRSGQSVLLVAGDTFRAAAINQLRIWGERVGVEVIAQKPGADPSSVVFDGLEYGVTHACDVILIDTAGRLHTSVNLMEELKKIKRVIGKKLPGAPHEVLLVLDATTGQNGVTQAKMFHEAVGVSGLTLTKLDGTAKGGIVANVCRETGIPVRFIGIGEQIDDLRDFDAREFVDALFAESER